MTGVTTPGNLGTGGGGRDGAIAEWCIRHRIAPHPGRVRFIVEGSLGAIDIAVECKCSSVFCRTPCMEDRPIFASEKTECDMRHVRLGSVRSLSAAKVGFDAQPMPTLIRQVDLKPGWRSPRLVRRADKSSRAAARSWDHLRRDELRRPPEVLDARAEPSLHRFRRVLAMLRPRARGHRRMSLRSLAIACLLGAATGAAGAYLLALLAPQTAQRVVVPVRYVFSTFGGAQAARPQPAAATIVLLPPVRPAAAGQGQFSGTTAAAAASPPASSALDALLQKARRELAEGRLEQPAGDNALESYRLLTATWPKEKGVTELGGAVGAAFWSRGTEARAAGDWQKALHYFEVVNSLPPLPVTAFPSAAAENERSVGRDDVTAR